MREIKFRYWNDVSKMMVDNPEMPFKEGWTIEQLFSERGWKWMQFTGLHDKNGKEIYEGDITNLGSVRRIVEYKDGAFIGIHRECEIIGNVYSTPELIK